MRVVTLEEEALYEAGALKVVANGAGYSLRHVRDGLVEEKIFQTADAAKSEILRRQPAMVA